MSTGGNRSNDWRRANDWWWANDDGGPTTAGQRLVVPWRQPQQSRMVWAGKSRSPGHRGEENMLDWMDAARGHVLRIIQGHNNQRDAGEQARLLELQVLNSIVPLREESERVRRDRPSRSRHRSEHSGRGSRGRQRSRSVGRRAPHVRGRSSERRAPGQGSRLPGARPRPGSLRLQSKQQQRRRPTQAQAQPQQGQHRSYQRPRSDQCHRSDQKSWASSALASPQGQQRARPEQQQRWRPPQKQQQRGQQQRGRPEQQQRGQQQQRAEQEDRRRDIHKTPSHSSGGSSSSSSSSSPATGVVRTEGGLQDGR